MTGKAKILIVEDDTPLAMMMVFLLTRAGCDAEVAPTGKEGIQLAQDGNFDLITLDIDLPDISGFKVFSCLKQNPRLCDTPIIFISGRSSDEDCRRGHELGAADYIEKPFGGFAFVRRILSHVKFAQTENNHVC